MLAVLLYDVTTPPDPHIMHAPRACSAVCTGLLCRMDLAAMTCTHLFLGILLVPLMGLDGLRGPCLTPCRSTLEILNCSRISNPPGFNQVPLPKLSVRKLISYVICVLKINCTAPTIQTACSKIGLLMKLFNENINKTSSIQKPYFWTLRNATDATKPNSRKLERPLDAEGSHRIAGYGNRSKTLLAISVMTIILITAAGICLFEIWYWHSTAKDKSILARRKTPQPDEELPRTPSLVADKKPLWLKDLYYIEHETVIKTLADKLYDEDESSEEVDIEHQGSARIAILKPTVEQITSDPSSVPIQEPLTALPAASPPPLPPPCD